MLPSHMQGSSLAACWTGSVPRLHGLQLHQQSNSRSSRLLAGQVARWSCRHSVPRSFVGWTLASAWCLVVLSAVCFVSQHAAEHPMRSWPPSATGEQLHLEAASAVGAQCAPPRQLHKPSSSRLLSTAHPLACLLLPPFLTQPLNTLLTLPSTHNPASLPPPGRCCQASGHPAQGLQGPALPHRHSAPQLCTQRGRHTRDQQAGPQAQLRSQRQRPSTHPQRPPGCQAGGGEAGRCVLVVVWWEAAAAAAAAVAAVAAAVAAGVDPIVGWCCSIAECQWKRG